MVPMIYMLQISPTVQLLTPPLYPSPSHSNTPKPTQIIPTPSNVWMSGICPIQTASVIATRPIVRRLATDEVVGPQIPINTIKPAFYSSAFSWISWEGAYVYSTTCRHDDKCIPDRTCISTLTSRPAECLYPRPMKEWNRYTEHDQCCETDTACYKV
jgi:hypothetical protein